MDRVIGLSELNVRVSAGTAVLHIRVRGTAFDRYYYYIKWEGVHRQNWREYFPWRFIELRGKVGKFGVDKNFPNRAKRWFHARVRGEGEKNLYRGVHGVAQGKATIFLQ